MGEEEKETTTMVTRHTTGALDFGTVSEAMKFAQLLCKSALVPESIRDKPADVMIVMLTGRALGIDSITALRQIHVIKGRTTMDASLLRALAMRHPDCEYLCMIEDGSAGRATWETSRRGQPKPVRISWTMDDAKRAGLANKDNWKNYPAAMLRARASADLVRAVYPEVGAGLYTPEEVADAQGAIIEVAADPVLRPEKRPILQAQSEPPVTDRQTTLLAVLGKHLGAQTVSALSNKLGFPAGPETEAQADMLIDTLRAEAESRTAPQPAPAQPEPKSPGDLPAPPAGETGDMWGAGRE